MVCLTLIQRQSSLLLLAIVTTITECDAFAFTSLVSAPTAIYHDVHRMMMKRIVTKCNSGSTSLNGKWDDLVDEDDIIEVCAYY